MGSLPSTPSFDFSDAVNAVRGKRERDLAQKAEKKGKKGQAVAADKKRKLLAEHAKEEAMGRVTRASRSIKKSPTGRLGTQPITSVKRLSI